MIKHLRQAVQDTTNLVTSLRLFVAQKCGFLTQFVAKFNVVISETFLIYCGIF